MFKHTSCTNPISPTSFSDYNSEVDEKPSSLCDTQLFQLQTPEFVDFSPELGEKLYEACPFSSDSICFPRDPEVGKNYILTLIFRETVKFWGKLYYIPFEEQHSIYIGSLKLGPKFNLEYEEETKHQLFKEINQGIDKVYPPDYSNPLKRGVESQFPGNLLFPWRFTQESILKEYMSDAPVFSESFDIEKFRYHVSTCLDTIREKIPTVLDFSQHFNTQKVCVNTSESDFKYRHLPHVIGAGQRKSEEIFKDILENDAIYARETPAWKNAVEERDAITLSAKGLFTIWYTNLVVDSLIETNPETGNCLTDEAIRDFFVDNQDRYSWVLTDLKKSGLTIPHELLKVMIEEVLQVTKSEQTKEVLGHFPYNGFPIFLKETHEDFRPKRGLGLGMANSLFTLMWTALFRYFKDLKKRDDLKFIAFNDDSALRAKENNLEESKKLQVSWTNFIVGSGNWVNFKKEVMTRKGGVFCERHHISDWTYNFKWVQLINTALKSLLEPSWLWFKLHLQPILWSDEALASTDTDKEDLFREITDFVIKIGGKIYHRGDFKCDLPVMFGGIGGDKTKYFTSQGLSLIYKLIEDNEISRTGIRYYAALNKAHAKCKWLFRPWDSRKKTWQFIRGAEKGDPLQYDLTDVNARFTGGLTNIFLDGPRLRVPDSEKIRFSAYLEEFLAEFLQEDNWQYLPWIYSPYTALEKRYVIPSQWVLRTWTPSESQVTLDEVVWRQHKRRSKYSPISHYATFLYYKHKDRGMKIVPKDELDYSVLFGDTFEFLPEDIKGNPLLTPEELSSFATIGVAKDSIMEYFQRTGEFPLKISQALTNSSNKIFEEFGKDSIPYNKIPLKYHNEIEYKSIPYEKHGTYTWLWIHGMSHDDILSNEDYLHEERTDEELPDDFVREQYFQCETEVDALQACRDVWEFVQPPREGESNTRIPVRALSEVLNRPAAQVAFDLDNLVHEVTNYLDENPESSLADSEEEYISFSDTERDCWDPG